VRFHDTSTRARVGSRTQQKHRRRTKQHLRLQQDIERILHKSEAEGRGALTVSFLSLLVTLRASRRRSPTSWRAAAGQRARHVKREIVSRVLLELTLNLSHVGYARIGDASTRGISGCD
jgi:hypothetical protein